MNLRRFSKPLLLISLVVSICLAAIVYRWTSHHIWFPLSQTQIVVNGHALRFSDYLPGKSLNGDIFLRSQDHGTQYLISPRNNEVSIITEEARFMEIGLFTYTRDDLVNAKYPNIKHAFSDSKLSVGNQFVEFTSVEGEHWRIAY